MPITRTPIIDDDGSGTTGTVIDNAWKQELYGQIDALAGGLASFVFGNWTPADASGAGLVFTIRGAQYVKVGRLVAVVADFSFPTTSNTALAAVTGLPYVNFGPLSGFYQNFYESVAFRLVTGDLQFTIHDANTSAMKKNNELSGALMAFAGIYFAGS